MERYADPRGDDLGRLRGRRRVRPRDPVPQPSRCGQARRRSRNPSVPEAPPSPWPANLVATRAPARATDSEALPVHRPRASPPSIGRCCTFARLGALMTNVPGLMRRDASADRPASTSSCLSTSNPSDASRRFLGRPNCGRDRCLSALEWCPRLNPGLGHGPEVIDPDEREPATRCAAFRRETGEDLWRVNRI